MPDTPGDPPRTRLVEALMLMEGTAAQKLELLEKLKTAGMLQYEDTAEVQRLERLLRESAVDEGTKEAAARGSDR
jgi:hypothetical protein